MITLKIIVLVLIGLILIYLIARIFTKGIIDQVEMHFKSQYKQFQNSKKNGTES